MLNHLVEYANRTGKSERGFGAKRFPWGLVFDENGALVSLMPEGKREFSKCPEMSQNELVRDNRSQFLYEKLGLLAGLPPKTGKAENYDKKRKSFIAQLANAAKVEPILEKIAATLASQKTQEWLLRVMKEKHATNIQESVLFVKERCLLEDVHLLDWWRTEYKRLRDAPSKAGKRPVSSAKRQRCLATGELTAPELRHPKIKGLKDVGGRGEDVLVSFDKDAFSSYGLKEGANAVLGPVATAAYRDALNSLIGKHSKRLGGAKVVYWYDREVKEDRNPIGFLDWGKDEEGDEERDELNALHKARHLLGAIQNGELWELAASRYFMLTLSGAAGRVMVRDWVEGQFGALARNVADWFEDMTIIHREGGRLAPSQKFISVLLALHSGLGDKASFSDKIKRIPPPFAAKMWRVAVCGERLPDSVLAKALAQFRSDLLANAEASPWARMNHARLGIMKAYFVRQAREKGVVNHMTTGLNENHPNPAYHCGRLMAVLAAVQNAALGTVGAGIVQRYYAAASATPALVFGRLIRTSQFHLGKLDTGLAHWFDRKIADIWNRLQQDTPTTLSLEEQTLFAMGYYQQMAADRGGNVSDKGEKIETAETNKEA